MRQRDRERIHIRTHTYVQVRKHGTQEHVRVEIERRSAKLLGGSTASSSSISSELSGLSVSSGVRTCAEQWSGLSDRSVCSEMSGQGVVGIGLTFLQKDKASGGLPVRPLTSDH